MAKYLSVVQKLMFSYSINQILHLKKMKNQEKFAKKGTFDFLNPRFGPKNRPIRGVPI